MANSIQIDLPSLSWNRNRFEVELTLFEVESTCGPGGSIDANIRLDSLLVNVLTGEIGEIDVALDWPKLQENNGKWKVEMYGAGHVAGILPDGWAMSSGLLNGQVMALDIVLPLFQTLIDSQFENSVGRLDVNLPSMSMTGVWNPHIIGRISGAIPLLNYYGTGKTGAIGSIDGDLHVLEYSGTLYSTGAGVIDVTLPIFLVDKYGTSTPSTISYKAVIMNTMNYSVSEYNDYNFDSMVQFKGRTFGASGNSIHLVGAQNDSGTDIVSSITTGNLDFHNPVVMLPRDVWLTLRSGKKVRMRVLEVEKPESEDNMYEYLSEEFVESLRNTRVKLGRGVRGQSVKFTVENIDGEELDIERIHILTAPLGRVR